MVEPDLFLDLIHFVTNGQKSAREDILPSVQNLFDLSKFKNFSNNSHSSNKNQPMYVAFFCLPGEFSAENLNTKNSGKIWLTSFPTSNPCNEDHVKEAKKIFSELFPGEIFLPKVPDPEDMVWEEHSSENSKVGSVGKEERVEKSEEPAQKVNQELSPENSSPSGTKEDSKLDPPIKGE